jgi:hypothetical protein
MLCYLLRWALRVQRDYCGSAPMVIREAIKALEGSDR